MDFTYYYSVVYSFVFSYPWIAAVIILVLALLLWKKPAVVVKMFVVVLFLAVALYIGSMLGDIGGSGVHNKNTMINETESKMSN